MSKRQLLAAVVGFSGLVLAGCGSSSLCDRGYDSNNQLNQKGAACGYAPLTFNRNLCEQEFGSCDSADQAALQDYFDCLAGVQACQPGNELSFEDQINACYNANAGVADPTCSDGFTAR